MSLRVRLLLAVSVITLVALSAASVATYSILSSSLYHRLDELLSASRSGFESAASHGLAIDCARGPGRIAPDGVHLARAPAFGHPGTLLSTQFVEVLGASGHVVRNQRCPAYVGSKQYVPVVPAAKAIASASAASSGTSYAMAASSTRGGPTFLVAMTRLPSGNLLVQGITVTEQVSTLHSLLIAEVIVSLVALVVALLVGWSLIGVGLRPLRKVSRTAASITSGSLDLRVANSSASTEVGQLGSAFNEMLDQIQGAFKERDDSEQKLRQFVADASHELRTPITAISAYAEFFAGDAKLDAAALERALGGIQRETERMEVLVEDLLALARLDDGVLGRRLPVELVRLCSDAVEAAAEIAPAWPVTLAASSPIEVMGDEEQLHRAVSNLLSNVRQHTEAGTTTTITIRSERDTAVIEVRDDGPGMTEEDARHAFDRFYRGDPSRSRSRGGSGLGLAIVRSIALAHGGTATLESSEGAGTLVRLQLPLAAPLS